MINPITLLERGIKTGSWQDICRAYKAMTNQTLTPPTGQPEKSGLLLSIYKQIHAHFEDVSEDEPTEPEVDDELEDEEPEPVIIPLRKKPVKKTTKKATKKQATQEPESDDSEEPPEEPAREPDFMDQFRVEHGEAHPEDGRTPAQLGKEKPFKNTFDPSKSKLAKKLIKHSQILSEHFEPDEEETRPEYKPVKVECFICKKKYDENPVIYRETRKAEANHICTGCSKKGFRD
jgi:hypothetical protein